MSRSLPAQQLNMDLTNITIFNVFKPSTNCGTVASSEQLIERLDF